jgi:hypothetical protein
MRQLRSLFALFVAAWAQPTIAQPPGVPTKLEVDAILLTAVREANSQLANTRLDDHTTFKAATYDKAVPLFVYSYSTSYLASQKRAAYSQAEIENLRQLHRDKTCGSQFAPLMWAYGLQVEHRMEDRRNGLQVLSLVFKSSDCKSKR